MKQLVQLGFLLVMALAAYISNAQSHSLAGSLGFQVFEEDFYISPVDRPAGNKSATHLSPMLLVLQQIWVSVSKNKAPY